MQAGVIGYHFTVAGVGVSAYQISTNVKFNVSVCFELPYLHVYTLCFNLALEYVKYVPCLMLIVLHILLDGVGKYLAVRSEWLQKRNFCHHTEFVLVNAYIFIWIWIINF